MKAAYGCRGGLYSTLALVCALLIVGCGGAASRLASHMERGRSYFAKGDFTHASIEFRNALQIAPKDTTARLMAARSAEGLGQFREAVSLYQSIVDSTPDEVEAHASLGRLFAFGGVPQRSLDIVEPALLKHPDTPSLLTVRAADRLQMKNEAGAAADADHALKFDPVNEDAIALRAGLYRQAGDLPHAQALVSDAVKKSPQSAVLREVLVNLYLSTDEPTKVEEQLLALIQLKPLDLRYRKMLALFYTRNHRLDDAQRILEAGVKVLPKNDDAKLALVSFIIAQRTPAQGEQALRGFIAAEPDNFQLRFGLADILQSAGDGKGAVAVYEEVISRDGTGTHGLLARDKVAAVDVVQGRSDAARKLVDEVLQKSPRDTDALLVRGEIELQRNDPAAAIADLRAVLRDQPKSVPVQRMIARAYLANGEHALAEQALRAAMDVDPKDTALRIELARLLAQTQRPEQAVALLEDAVRQDPNDAAAREGLIHAYLAKNDFGAARAAAEDLATLRPQSAVGPYLAGLAAQGDKRLDEAQKYFERAYALQPQVSEPLTALAQLQLSRGQNAQAIALVQGAVAAAPKDAVPLNLLGEVYLATHDVPHAIDALTRATAVAPKWWPPYRNLALAKTAAKDTAGAIAAYEAGMQVAPGTPQLAVELAQLYERQGRVDAAIAQYEALHKRDPGLELVANNLAMLLVTYKSDRRSLDRARDLTAPFASSTAGGLLDTNGWVHFKRGEYADALPILERAAERAPDAKEIRYHLGMAELQAGKSDRARTDLETATSSAEKYPWSDDARSVLAGLKNRTG